MSVYIWGGQEKYFGYRAIEKSHNKIYLRQSQDEQPTHKEWPTPVLVEHIGSEGKSFYIDGEGDFHYGGIQAYLLSERAVNVLYDMLKMSGYWLPVVIEGRNERFYRYCCTNVVDCLDLHETETWPSSYGKEGKIGVIKKPAFIRNKLGSNQLFRVPQDPNNLLFVTDDFIRSVEKGALKGFEFSRYRFDPNPVRI